MAQVNVAYDDSLLRHLDALAAKRGVSRPDLLRAVAEEAVRADEQGLAMFAPPSPIEQPINAEQTMHMVHELRELSMGLDRLLRSAEKREKQLMAACNATEEANRSARERHGQELAERFREGSTPYLVMLEELRAQVDSKLDVAVKAMRTSSASDLIRSDLAKLHQEMHAGFSKARPSVHWHFGRDIQLNPWGMLLAGFAGLVLLCVLQSGLAKVLPYDLIATPLAKTLYGSADTGICELYKSSRRLGDCPSLAPIKTGGK